MRIQFVTGRLVKVTKNNWTVKNVKMEARHVIFVGIMEVELLLKMMGLWNKRLKFWNGTTESTKS